MKKLKPNELSQYWIQSVIDPKDLMQKARVLRAIRNYVNLTTGNADIRVEYHSVNESYTDGKTITLSDIHAGTNYDIVVGLALHESSHHKYTSFQLWNDMLTNGWIEKVFDEYLKDYEVELLKDSMRTLVNVIEDRRIDKLMQNEYSGLVGYYEALYSEYFLSDAVTNGINSSSFTDADKLDDYMFRIINILNPACENNADVLPKLAQIYSLIDLKSISRLNNTQEVIALSTQILKLILDDIKNPSVNKSDPNKRKLSANEKRVLKTLMGKIGDLLNGSVKKQKLTKQEVEIVSELAQMMEERQITDTEVGKVNTYIYKGINRRVIDNNMFPALSSTDENQSTVRGIERGISIGKALKNRLKTRDERRQYNKYNLEYGKIDKRKLCQAGYNSKIFCRKEILAEVPIYAMVSLDASGSMWGTAWERAVQTAVALMVATKDSKTIHLAVSLRGEYNDIPFTWIVYDSSTDNLYTTLELMKHIVPNSSTPEGLCYQNIMESVIGSAKNKKAYLINVSDGCPYFSNDEVNYGNVTGVNHTARIISKMEQSGLNVMSYYVSNNYPSTKVRSDFDTMYGKRNTSYIDVDELGQLANSLNNLFVRNV